MNTEDFYYNDMTYDNVSNDTDASWWVEMAVFIFFVRWLWNHLDIDIDDNPLREFLYNVWMGMQLYFEHSIDYLSLNEEDSVEMSTQNQPKYEDKYIEEVRNMPNDWDCVFKEEERTKRQQLSDEYFFLYVHEIEEEIRTRNGKIEEIQKEMETDTDELKYEVLVDHEGGEETIEETSLEERTQHRNEKIQRLEAEIKVLYKKINTEEGLSSLKKKADELALQNVIKRHTQLWENRLVMEHTPLGNVIMTYVPEKESFHYYSDFSIPYRYLEVVARKYIKMFQCRPVYVDMEKELELLEQKWEEKEQLEQARAERAKHEQAIPNAQSDAETSSLHNTQTQTPVNEPKKNVFVKFKSYNKPICGSGVSPAVTCVAGPSNNILSIRAEKDNEKVLLKDKANRYVYGGKLSNYSFLKKVPKSLFNKTLKMSYADYKKSRQQNKS